MFLHHVTVTTPPEKVGDMIEFYENLCDLTPLAVPEGLRDRAIWYEMLGTDNGAQLHIYITRESRPLRSGAHVAFAVASNNPYGREVYDRVVALAKLKGIFLGDGTQYWGSPRAYILDPAANRVEVFQFSPSQAMS
jgi:catechol 2,3-dioxygenase-like lactoylglutathione lyase family enzyme